MGILDDMLKRLKAKDKNGKEMNPGFVIDGEPKTIQDIEKVFHAFKLDKYLDAIKPLVRPKIDLVLTPADESEFEISESKIGGQPHLSKVQGWPKNELGKSLSFIGQLNLEEVSKFDKSGLLPMQGLLSFFYCADQEAWGFDPKDKQRFKVLYSDKDSELIKYDFPADLEQHSIYNSNQIIFTSSLSLPTWEQDSIEGLIQNDDSDNYMEASSGTKNQILGYANCVQGTMELECQLVTNGLYCGNETGFEDPRRKELEAGKDDWVLLLQIDSEDDKTGMMWGDLGRIYYWIRKQDLKNRDFQKTWCVLQCH